MALRTHEPSTDLLLPLPVPGERWDPHLVHTHYFGFSVPDACIGVFTYVRYQPAFPLSQGGVCVFQGTDNVEYTDIAFLDYENTMPWPRIEDARITTDNGLSIHFIEPGRTALIGYQSCDERLSIDVRAEAISPLVARGYVMPGEEEHLDPARGPGGSEQFMHVTGELRLDGASYPVDCFAVRDRSWRQIRVERRGAVPVPPTGWSPISFGPELNFSQVGFEPLDTEPAWAGLYDVGDKPAHHFAWVVRDNDIRGVRWVRRDVLERHSRTHMPLRQEISAEDDRGEVYRFRGEAIACASLPQWPNTSFHDSVYRWTDEQGRITYSSYQELWFDDYQRAMKARALDAVTNGGML